MSEAVGTTLLTSGLLFLGTVATVYGTKFVAKLTARSKSEELQLEQDKVRAGAYVEARGAYRELTTDLRDEIGGLRKAMAEDRAAHRQELLELDERHRQQIEEMRETHREEIADLRRERRENDARLNARIDDMEARDNLSQKRIQALGAYIRQLIGVLREHDVEPPQPPPGITFD